MATAPKKNQNEAAENQFAPTQSLAFQVNHLQMLRKKRKKAAAEQA
jgi:hypothetical protein